MFQESAPAVSPDPACAPGVGARRRPRASLVGMPPTAKLNLVLELGHEWKFDELPPGSIALDGAVQGPQVDAAARRFSFDHHAGCIRLLTSATCRQVFDAMLLGLDPDGLSVYVNDLDGDTVLSLWLLENAPRWRDRDAVRRVRALVECVSTVDAHGPAYPVDDPDLMRTFYDGMLGEVSSERAAGYPSKVQVVLRAALARLERWWEEGFASRSPAIPVPVTPEIALQGTWVLATLPASGGDHVSATAAWLYERGHDRMVIGGLSAAGGWRYLLARRSDLVAGFPLDAFYRELNRREAEVRGSPLIPGQTWGGGSSVGGGPRLDSVLDPHAVRDVIARVLAA